MDSAGRSSVVVDTDVGAAVVATALNCGLGLGDLLGMESDFEESAK